MMKKSDVTVEVATKNRYYTTLPMCLTSIANQTVLPKKILLFDDGEQKDLREDATYKNIFALLQNKGIEWQVCFGERKGQVLCHQKSIEIAQTEYIWRIDDDDLVESECLEYLLESIREPNVGAVGGLVLTPGNVQAETGFASSRIEDIYTKPNLQWFVFDGVREVDHLHNTFLFRKSAAKHGYCMNLSPVGHREETIFTYEMRRAGYKILVDSRAKSWHMRDPKGGIRSYESTFLWEHDERIFAQKMIEWQVQKSKTKLIVLNCGLGDHYAFKMMLDELLQKYADHEIIIASCYREVFIDYPQIKQISISEAAIMEPDYDNKFNIYKFMIDKNWKNKLVDAFRAMYL